MSRFCLAVHSRLGPGPSSKPFLSPGLSQIPCSGSTLDRCDRAYSHGLPCRGTLSILAWGQVLPMLSVCIPCNSDTALLKGHAVRDRLMKLAMAERCILRKKKCCMSLASQSWAAGTVDVAKRSCAEATQSYASGSLHWALSPWPQRRIQKSPRSTARKAAMPQLLFCLHSTYPSHLPCLLPTPLQAPRQHQTSAVLQPHSRRNPSVGQAGDRRVPERSNLAGRRTCKPQKYIPATTYPLDTNLRLLSTGQRSWSTMRSFALACNCLTEARTAHEIAQRRDGTGCLVIPEAQHHAYLH